MGFCFVVLLVCFVLFLFLPPKWFCTGVFSLRNAESSDINSQSIVHALRIQLIVKCALVNVLLVLSDLVH